MNFFFASKNSYLNFFRVSKLFIYFLPVMPLSVVEHIRNVHRCIFGLYFFGNVKINYLMKWKASKKVILGDQVKNIC